MTTAHEGVEDVCRLATTLGRPVAKGHLGLARAEAAILVFCLRSAREGRLAHDPVEVVGVATHIMQLGADNITAHRERTIGAIRRAIRPLIGIRASSGRIRAAAHDANGLAGFLLSETEVEEVAKIDAWRFIQRSGEGRQHG